MGHRTGCRGFDTTVGTPGGEILRPFAGSLGQRTVIVLLGSWCLINLVQTTQALTGPAGWVAGRPESDSGFVGMPLQGSGAVAAIGKLLGNEPKVDELALVILPADLNPTLSTYIRYQLAHLRYPQRVDVISANGTDNPGDSYAIVVVASGTRLTAPWVLMKTLLGFSAYVRGEP